MDNPITQVILLNVPLENDYKHTFYFDDAENQSRIMLGYKINDGYTDFTYQRKDNTIRIPDLYDNVIKANYVMYKNANFNNKWFYAFIIDYEYKGEDQTNIKIETDVMQTWMFDFNLRQSFVEREHTDDDTIGANTYPENIEMGEYICLKKSMMDEFNDLRIVLGIITDTAGNILTGIYNGIFSGVQYLPYKLSEIDKLKKFIRLFAEKGKNDSIKCMFLAPKFLCGMYGDAEEQPESGGNIVKDTNEAVLKQVFINRLLYRDRESYKPKNKKLLVYPYHYLLVSNNNGGSAIYQYEHFSGDTITFNVEGCLTPGCSIRMHPLGYKGIAENDEEGLNLGKYPVCNWTSDEYINWLTQNGANISTNLVSGLGQIVIGAAIATGTVATGGMAGLVGAGTVMGGVTTITNQLNQIHQASFTPAQSRGNINSGDVITASGKNTLHIYGMGIKDEYMKIIDEYFTMFGYKSNRVKIPNSNHRSNFWFTKTIDVNIHSTKVPADDLKKIKNCYNNGITFWKNFTYFKNYSVDNPII